MFKTVNFVTIIGKKKKTTRIRLQSKSLGFLINPCSKERKVAGTPGNKTQTISVDRNQSKGGTAPQGHPGLQRGKEPGNLQSCGPSVLQTGQGGAPPL